jgi:asparagine synthetase A
VFFPLDVVTIDNNLNFDLNCKIEAKKVNIKFTLGRGFFYEFNGIRYNVIPKSGDCKIKQNDSIMLMQVERHDDLNIIDTINNIVENITITDENKNKYFELKNLLTDNIKTIETNVNNWRVHKIYIK